MDKFIKRSKQTQEDFEKERDDTIWMMARFPFPKDIFLLNKHRILPGDGDVKSAMSKEDLTIFNLEELGVLSDVLYSSEPCLEIGCGMGVALEYLANNGNGTYYSLEPEEEAFDFVKKRLDKNKNIIILKEKIEEKKFESGFFDFIYSHHVIEHIENPMIMLEKSREWLKKGGKLIISSPNAEAFHPKFLGIDKWRMRFPTHIWLPGKSNLFRILEANGFKILKYITYGGFVAPRNIFKNIGNWLLKKWNLGDNIVILAEKI
tara:strand:+ start:726 stop:1511 length:786 start_codon:yes stop_codon:yes gene_type:complete